MTSSTQLRAWWDAWECDTDKYVRHEFPGDGRVWNLWVADASDNAWDRFTDLMVKHDYPFISSAGGTYKCRNIGGTNVRSESSRSESSLLTLRGSSVTTMRPRLLRFVPTRYQDKP